MSGAGESLSGHGPHEVRERERGTRGPERGTRAGLGVGLAGPGALGSRVGGVRGLLVAGGGRAGSGPAGAASGTAPRRDRQHAGQHEHRRVAPCRQHDGRDADAEHPAERLRRVHRGVRLPRARRSGRRRTRAPGSRTAGRTRRRRRRPAVTPARGSTHRPGRRGAGQAQLADAEHGEDPAQRAGAAEPVRHPDRQRAAGAVRAQQQARATARPRAAPRRAAAPSVARNVMSNSDTALAQNRIRYISGATPVRIASRGEYWRTAFTAPPVQRPLARVDVRRPPVRGRVTQHHAGGQHHQEDQHGRWRSASAPAGHRPQ